jgi:hypothetical protein
MRSKLKNHCAVEATVEAWKRLRENNVPCRFLMLAHPANEEGHCGVVFETPGGGALFYDADGSVELRGLRLHSLALAVARSVFPTCKAAYWLGGSRTLNRQGPDRKLSPLECRSHLPAFDRLLELEEAPAIPLGRRMSPREARGRSLFTV